MQSITSSVQPRLARVSARCSSMLPVLPSSAEAARARSTATAQSSRRATTTAQLDRPPTAFLLHIACLVHLLGIGTYRPFLLICGGLLCEGFFPSVSLVSTYTLLSLTPLSIPYPLMTNATKSINTSTSTDLDSLGYAM